MKEPSGSASTSPESTVYASKLQKSDLPWSGSPSPYNAEVKLGDGRRVALHYRQGKGLVGQHYSPRAKAWTESIAAVATGGLTDWSVNVTKNFGGWERASVSDDGQRVVFGRGTVLRWSRDNGFERL
ncbi:hypothetical protein [Streptomyces hokutonensis]|uniref:hypothetical protein n=1 Tax=Streptomyces hokutonensis TaxID=1306990 RepID=UPI00380589B9